MQTVNHKRNQKGFTIIEVLIVLAIAGLIMLVVFLAVPALQRNSRNTAIKNDVQNVLGGVSESLGANSGVGPKDITSAADGTITYANTNPTTIKVQAGTTVSSTAAAPAAAAPALATIVVSRGFKCSGTASARTYSALYSLESATGTIRQCTEV